MKFLETLGCTDTLLTRLEKQTVEDILVECHKIFARHRMDTGWIRSSNETHTKSCQSFLLQKLANFDPSETRLDR